MDIKEHPSVSINNHTYIGDFNGHDIAMAICASFKDRPNVCTEIIRDAHIFGVDFLKGSDEEYRFVYNGNDTIFRDMTIIGLLVIVVMTGMILIHKSG